MYLFGSSASLPLTQLNVRYMYQIDYRSQCCRRIKVISQCRPHSLLSHYQTREEKTKKIIKNTIKKITAHRLGIQINLGTSPWRPWSTQQSWQPFTATSPNQTVLPWIPIKNISIQRFNRNRKKSEHIFLIKKSGHWILV